MNDKKKSVLNVGVSISFHVATLIASIIVRRLLIQSLGNDINGLHSLFLSIVGVLSVAELGVGSAITFAMYKPIVNDEKNEIIALYQLYKKTYFIIGGVILLVGLLLIPVLPWIAKDYSYSYKDLYISFVLMLISTVLSYTYSSKISLINAYKDNYVTTAINSASILLQYVLQAAVLLCGGDFSAFLACKIIAVLTEWCLSSIITRIKHGDIINSSRKQLSTESKQSVIKNVKALFLHRIGGILVNSSDSIIISAYVGVVALGAFSNYTTIAVSMLGVISLFFSPLTSIIGHLFVSSKSRAKESYNLFFTANFILGIIFFLGYYSVIDDLVIILFGEGLGIAKEITFVITVNYFVQFMRQSTILFKDASGVFYNDRWKPFFEGILNIILSIALVVWFGKIFGEQWAVVGVILATIVTNLTICHVVEPIVLYRHAFSSSPKKHMVKRYVYIFVFIVLLFALELSTIDFANPFVSLLANGLLSLVYSALMLIMICLIDSEFRRFLIETVFKNKRKSSMRDSK